MKAVRNLQLVLTDTVIPRYNVPPLKRTPLVTDNSKKREMLKIKDNRAQKW